VKKKRRPKKDPNRPKRNMSAFFLYSNANRSRIKEENEGIAFGAVVSNFNAECCVA
jgi:structure-specific recognition protein 1